MYVPIALSMDKLSIFYKASFRSIERLLAEYEELESAGLIRLDRWIGKRAAEYHYNFNFKPVLGSYNSDTSVYMGFDHNSSKKDKISNDCFLVKVEFNPNKVSRNDPLITPLQVHWQLLQKFVKGFDLAFDIPLTLDEINIESVTGRDCNRVKTTRYYGQRGKDGYSKLYDKALEQKLDGVTLSRFEYSKVLASPIPIDDFFRVKVLDIGSRYRLFFGRVKEKSDIVFNLLLKALYKGEITLNQLPDYTKRKIKKANHDLYSPNLDQIVSENWESITGYIQSLLYHDFTSFMLEGKSKII